MKMSFIKCNPQLKNSLKQLSITLPFYKRNTKVLEFIFGLRNSDIIYDRCAENSPVNILSYYGMMFN